MKGLPRFARSGWPHKSRQSSNHGNHGQILEPVSLGWAAGGLAGALRGIPMHRLGTPADMAGAALFLASPLAGYITGQTIIVDGGLTL